MSVATLVYPDHIATGCKYTSICFERVSYKDKDITDILS